MRITFVYSLVEIITPLMLLSTLVASVACTEGIFLPQDYTVVSGERIVK